MEANQHKSRTTTNVSLLSCYKINDKKFLLLFFVFERIPTTGSKSGDYEEVRERPYTKLLTNGSLLLQHVKEDREGFYLCQAHNGIGTGIGKVIQLKVNCRSCFTIDTRGHTNEKSIYFSITLLLGTVQNGNG